MRGHAGEAQVPASVQCCVTAGTATAGRPEVQASIEGSMTFPINGGGNAVRWLEKEYKVSALKSTWSKSVAVGKNSEGKPVAVKITYGGGGRAAGAGLSFDQTIRSYGEQCIDSASPSSPDKTPKSERAPPPNISPMSERFRENSGPRVDALPPETREPPTRYYA